MLLASLVAVAFVVIQPQRSYIGRTRTFSQKFLSIEYCTGCRWDFRAFWLVQELLDREPDFDLLVIPSPIAGTFDVKDFTGKSIFMKSKGRSFPDPSIELVGWIEKSDVTTDDVQCTENDSSLHIPILLNVLENYCNTTLPCVDIAYRRAHRQRALYLAQECLRTFSDEVNSLSLRVTETVDDLQVSVVNAPLPDDPSIIWQRGFPETKVIKQKIRDALVPNKPLGHSDIPSKVYEDDKASYDEEEAAEARQFFGVS